HEVDAIEGAPLVDRRKVERSAAAARFGGLVAPVLAAQETAGERTPDHQAEAFALQHRDQLALEVAAGDRVIRLQALEARQAEPLGNDERLRDLPGRPVRNADVAHMAVLHHGVERTHRFLERRRWIEAVDLVQVDVIELQALQARLQSGDDVAARRAAHIRARAGRVEDLGRDDDVLARYLQVAERLAGDLFGAAVGVDVGGVDEVDAGIERAADDALRFLLLKLADLRLYAAVVAAAEGHGAEAELGDEQAGAAEGLVFHGGPLLQRAPNAAFSNKSRTTSGAWGAAI